MKLFRVKVRSPNSHHIRLLNNFIFCDGFCLYKKSIGIDKIRHVAYTISTLQNDLLVIPTK